MEQELPQEELDPDLPEAAAASLQLAPGCEVIYEVPKDLMNIRDVHIYTHILYVCM